MNSPLQLKGVNKINGNKLFCIRHSPFPFQPVIHLFEWWRLLSKSFQFSSITEKFTNDFWTVSIAWKYVWTEEDKPYWEISQELRMLSGRPLTFIIDDTSVGGHLKISWGHCFQLLSHCRKQNDGRNIENYRSGSKVRL